jgi:hypothetical protein
MRRLAFLVVLGGCCGSALATDPWADQVISYLAGSGVNPAYTFPDRALGEPTRFSPDLQFPGVVSPFNPAYQSQHLVSIGPGGSLTLRFSEPVTNDPANPFGIDLLVFGNAGYSDNNGIAGPLFGNDGGTVEVSADGTNWFLIPGIAADGPFPTLGYSDLTDPYHPAPGLVLSDFTRPVNPALNPVGLSFAALVAAYNGSGGGAGIDLSAVGLSAISFVRISAPANTLDPVDIDAVSDVSAVPGPGAGLILAFTGAAMRRRRR